MTAAAGISSAPAGRPMGVAAKSPEPADEEANRSDAAELGAFSELFTQLESENDVSGEPASGMDEPDTDDGSEALAAEATHHRWFGGDGPPPAEQDAPRRIAPLLIQRKDDEAPLEPVQKPGTVMPPFGVSGWFDLQPPEEGSRTKQDAASDIRVEQIGQLQANLMFPAAFAAGSGQNEAAGSGLELAGLDDKAEPAPQLKLREVTQTLAKARMAGNVSPPTLSTASPLPQPAAQTDLRGGLPPNVKESLFALETVLSKGGSMDGANTGAKNGRQLDAAAIKDARITALRQETYFNPAGFFPSPAAQIADRIDSDIQAGGLQGAQQPSSPTRSDAAAPPLRVLHIQLDPPQLGPLTIRISLKDEALNLQLETPRYETARLIHNDREAISGLLQSAGYAIDTLNIQLSTADPGMGGQLSNGTGPFGQPGGQQHPGWRHPGGQPSAQPIASYAASDPNAGNGGDEQAAPAGRARSGSVYL